MLMEVQQRNKALKIFKVFSSTKSSRIMLSTLLIEQKVWVALSNPATFPQMRRLPSLVAVLLVSAASPLLLVTAAFTMALLVSQAPAQAQSAEAVAKVAQAITVRIEGATQGSGPPSGRRFGITDSVRTS